MDGNQNIRYISPETTQCPNCFGMLDERDKVRGTFFCLYCGQRLAIGAEPVMQTQQPIAPVAAPYIPTTPDAQSATPYVQQDVPVQPTPVAPPPPQTPQQTYRPANNPKPVKKGINAKDVDTLGVISLVIGAIGMLFSCCYGVGIILCIAAIVLAVFSNKKRKENNKKADVTAILGLTFGIIGIVFGSLMTIYLIIPGGYKDQKTEPYSSPYSYSTGTSGKTEKEVASETEPTTSEDSSDYDFWGALFGEDDKEDASEEDKSEKKSGKKSEEPKSEEASPKKEVDANGLSKEFKEAMDAYEAFVDEYVAFMKKMNADPTNMDLLTEYMTYMAKMEEMTEKMNAWEGNMTPQEEKYYMEVMNRCNKKMMEYALQN